MRFFLIIMMLLSFVACGTDSKKSNDSDNAVTDDSEVTDEITDETADETVDEGTDEDAVDLPVVTDTVLLKTNMGDITIGLYENELPITTANFKQYVTDKFYDGLIFHRIVPAFVIQAGGYDHELNAKEIREPIKFESNPKVRHVKYAVSMARGQSPNSATSQFFITLAAFPHLDYNSDDDFLDENKFPCAVFGIVTEGFDIVDAIGTVKTETVGQFEGIPVEPVIIESASLIEPI